MTAPRGLSSSVEIFSIARRISSGNLTEKTCFLTSSPLRFWFTSLDNVIVSKMDL